MAWRVARSLDVLLGQLNTLAPRRSKASDGSIGDAAHATRDSDHNPWYGPGIVTARDFTHDPGGGLDCHTLASILVAHRDPRVKYIIWNRRILSGNPGPSPWVWRAYSESNPHTKHLHLSVVASPACDSTAAWAGLIPGPPPPPPEVRDVNLSDSMRPFFNDGWPEDIRNQTVGATLANMFSYVYSMAARLAALEGRPTAVADVDEDELADALMARGLTGGASKAEVKDAVREVLPTVRLVSQEGNPA